MADQVVDFFGIELGLIDKVTKDLKKVEATSLKIAQNIENAFKRIQTKITPPNMPRPNGGGNKQNYSDRAYAAANSAMLNRLMNHSDERVRQFAAQTRQHIFAAGETATRTGDGSAFRRSMIDTANNVRNFSRTLNTASAGASRGLTKFQSGLGSAHNGLLKIAAAGYAIHRAVDYIHQAIERGVERQRGVLSMQAAYTKPGEADAQMKAVKELSDKYGTPLAEAMQQSAALKNTLPGDISDAVIAAFHEGSTVLARTTGMSDDQTRRMSIAIEKLSASGKNIGRSWNSLILNAPALLSKMAKAKGFQNTTDLRDYFKQKGGQASAREIIAYINKYPQLLAGNGKTNAQNVQTSLQTKLSQATNATTDAMDLFTKGATDGLGYLVNSIVQFVKDNGWAFTTLGKMVGGISEAFGRGIRHLDRFFLELYNYYLGFRIWYNNLDGATKTLVDNFSKYAADIVAAMMGAGGLLAVLGLLKTAFWVLWSPVKALGGLLKFLVPAGEAGAAVAGSEAAVATGAAVTGGELAAGSVLAAMGGAEVLAAIAVAALTAYGLGKLWDALKPSYDKKDLDSSGQYYHNTLAGNAIDGARNAWNKITSSDTFQGLQKYDKQNMMSTNSYSYGAPNGMAPQVQKVEVTVKTSPVEINVAATTPEGLKQQIAHTAKDIFDEAHQAVTFNTASLMALPR
ncbi:tape measure protein [Escherichia coli]|nr:tape measure protein [Escherichia coli]MBJ0329695.1 tape measure protein [Escherichia coli]